MSDTQQKAGTGRLLRLALAVSVAVNLAVLGLVAGAMVKFGAGPPPPVRELGFGPFSEALTKDQRSELRRAFAARNTDFRAMRREMRDDISGMLTVLRATPFDGAAFSERLARMNGRFAARVADGEAALRDLVLGMNAEERLAFADRLEGRLRGPRGDGGRSHD